MEKWWKERKELRDEIIERDLTGESPIPCEFDRLNFGFKIFLTYGFKT